MYINNPDHFSQTIIDYNRKCVQHKLDIIGNYIIEHSKKKIIMPFGLFENEIGPAVLNSSIQQAPAQRQYQQCKPSTTVYVSILSLLCEIFAVNC